MKVGAIIVNWNSFDYLYRSLDAILSQEVKFSRVVVIDNASKNPPAKLPAKYKSVEYIKLTYNSGFAGGNNYAIEMLSDCDWIALINPDAFLDTKWLNHLSTAVKEHPDYSFFASRIMIADNPQIIDGVGDIYHISGLAWRAGHGITFDQNKLQDREVFSPCAAAALYRRDALVEIGGFDEDFFCYMEDIDLGFRLRLAGHRCLFVNSAVACHVGSATSGGSHSPFSVYHGHRNLVWAYIKNMPGFLFWAILPLHIALNFFTLVLFIYRGQTKVIFKAKYDAIIGIKKMWKKRSRIQYGRAISSMQVWRILDKRLNPFLGRKSLK